MQSWGPTVVLMVLSLTLLGWWLVVRAIPRLRDQPFWSFIAVAWLWLCVPTMAIDLTFQSPALQLWFIVSWSVLPFAVLVWIDRTRRSAASRRPLDRGNNTAS